MFLWFLYIQTGINQVIHHQPFVTVLDKTNLEAQNCRLVRGKNAPKQQSCHKKTRQTLIPNITVVSRPHPRYICQQPYKFQSERLWCFSIWGNHFLKTLIMSITDHFKPVLRTFGVLGSGALLRPNFRLISPRILILME